MPNRRCIAHGPIQAFHLAGVVRCCIAVASPWLLAGCANINEPPRDLARNDVPIRSQFAAASGLTFPETTSAGWLASFSDSALTSIIEEAVRSNPDLRAAAARVDEARARARVAESYLWPQIDGAGNVSRQRVATAGTRGGTTTYTQYELGGALSWELDLWGRLRSLSEAERQSAAAVQLDYQFARLSLAAQVADTWFLTIQAGQQLQIDREHFETEERTARITRDKAVTGIGGQLDAELQEANLRLAADAVRRDEQSIQELTRAIEVLIGRYPSAELAVASTLPTISSHVPVGLPSELLERRPDMRAADRRVAAAFHAVDAAKAAQLPRVTLSASLGWLIDPNTSFWSVGGGLLAPLIDGGRLQAEVELSDAVQRQEIAFYVATAINAFREVETAMGNEASLVSREAELRDAASRSQAASRIGEDRYAVGILSIVDLTTIRRQEFETRSLLLQVSTDRLRQRLALYRALGGSFESETSEPSGQGTSSMPVTQGASP